MGDYEQREMSGSLFPNDKDGVSKRPDVTGSCRIKGQEFRIAGWEKSKDGKQFMSLAFSEPRPKRDDVPRDTQRPDPPPDMGSPSGESDDVPF